MCVKDAYQDVLREIMIMKELDHICMTRLHEVINQENKDKLYLVMDYAKYGQIMNWDPETLKFAPCFKNKTHFDEVDIQKIIRDCVRCIDYSKLLNENLNLVHRKGVLHRDIKP